VPAKKVAEPLKVGDLVTIRNSGIKRGRIIELRGPLGPGGAQIYRVRVRRKPKPVYIELREDQLVLIPGGHKPPVQEKAPAVVPVPVTAVKNVTAD
jgi:hypothetical protein